MENESKNFIENIIDADIESGNKTVVTRFPPENNAKTLHLGHAKSIHLNYGIANKYNGVCNFRIDDTNPTNEKEEYITGLKEDLKWLGFPTYTTFRASDYFYNMKLYAIMLIERGLAYVCDLSSSEIAEYRGSITTNGIESPHRNRTIEENSDLFFDMSKGKYEEGEKSLRLKIDMTSPNVHLRDPIIYRIKNVDGANEVYPMYDFAHCISDSIEGITHSLCTLEFEVHRPLYEWILNNLNVHVPKQIEFARFNLGYTIMSKRKLSELVDNNLVSGWDDPRMPTISGLRRRGYTPSSIKSFMELVGISKRDNIIDTDLLEFSIRNELNKTADRRFAVLDPIKLVIDNYPDTIEKTKATNNPENEERGKRDMVFSKELWIERDDFREEANRKYNRLVPGRFVRLKYGYIVECTGCVKDDDGNIIEVHCDYVPESKSGEDTSGIKPKGTIHWISTSNAIDVEFRLYDRLFNVEDPSSLEDFKDGINHDSLVVKHGKTEYMMRNYPYMMEEKYQFERTGYFCFDSDSTSKNIVMNRIVGLKSSWK